MEAKRVCVGMKACILLYFALFVVSFTHCDADRSNQLLQVPRHRKSSTISKVSKKLRWIKHFDMDPSLYSPNSVPYSVSSPFSLPPYDSLPPENSPPFCVSPPNTPLPPPATTSVPTPGVYTPPPGQSGLNPSPTVSTGPSPPQRILSPPVYSPGPPGPTLSPPYFEPSPPSFVPSPTGFLPSPPIFEPPVVFPPPRVPPPPPNSGAGAGIGLWCVAKPSVPDPIIEEAMNYACGSGADCAPIQPEGPCFQPNTFIAHASYAFNSYWQMTKAAGGNCEFGGTAILVSIDPSYDGCHFLYY